MKKLKILGTVFITVFLLLALVVPASASISPTLLEAELAPGESTTETKTVHIEEMPPQADVVFAFDLTSSMSGVISTAKTNATSIMTQLNALGSDVNFGVMSYMDYPHSYSSFGYPPVPPYPPGSTIAYGSAVAGDYAYILDQAVTSSTSAVSTAINALTIGSGADGPQDYTRIMYESYADSSVNWRSGAKRIVVNFGDNVPHDNNLNAGVPGTSGTWSTGGDPGRDEIILNVDDLDLQTVLAAMNANGITLLEAHTSNWIVGDGYSGGTSVPVFDYWDYWTGITGGSTYLTSSSTLVTDIVAAVDAVLTVPLADGVHLEASSPYESWVSTTPGSYDGVVRCVDDVEFEVTITVPEDATPGIHTFTISVKDEDGVNYGDQTVIITVPEPVIEVDIDIKPGSDPNSINLNGNGVVPVAILGTATFDVTTVDALTVTFGPGGASMVHKNAHLEDVNGDGFIDMVLHFKTQDTGIAPDDTEAALTGQTLGGTDIYGTDSVRTVPPKG